MVAFHTKKSVLLVCLLIYSVVEFYRWMGYHYFKWKSVSFTTLMHQVWHVVAPLQFISEYRDTVIELVIEWKLFREINPWCQFVDDFRSQFKFKRNFVFRNLVPGHQITKYFCTLHSYKVDMFYPFLCSNHLITIRHKKVAPNMNLDGKFVCAAGILVGPRIIQEIRGVSM